MLLRRSAVPRRRVHVVNPLINADGGSEWHATSLYTMLAERCDARLWAPPTGSELDPRILDRFPVRRIDPWRLRLPFGGVVVLVSIYFSLGRWLRAAAPRRIVLLVNLFSRSLLDGRLRELERLGLRDRTEFIFASALIRDWAGLPGLVEPSYIDLDRFRPPPPPPERPFTVGRLSRDIPNKHHPRDPELYRAIAARGAHVRIMGGTCLAPALEDVAGVELLPTMAEPAPSFLHSLDCFYYRQPEGIRESFGRVIFEAMASGLPVVCHRAGGYVEFIDHGRTGFLTTSFEEARDTLLRLQADSDLRRRVGRAARAAVEDLYAPARYDELAAYYTR